MAQIRPFAGVHFSRQRGPDISNLIAPPYDVLDEKGRAALQAKDPHNIVNVDLPHLPPKTVGPDEVYEKANITLQAWLKSGVLERDPRRPCIRTRRPTSTTAARSTAADSSRWCGSRRSAKAMSCRTRRPTRADRGSPEADARDRHAAVADLRAVQRSAQRGDRLLYKNLGRPEFTATLDGVKNDLWSVIDADVENQVIDLMGTKPVYIADGHHRYTTALQYQKEAGAAQRRQTAAAEPPGQLLHVRPRRHAGRRPADPADASPDRRTRRLRHRRVQAGGRRRLRRGRDDRCGPSSVAEYVDIAACRCSPPHTFGLYDGKTRRNCIS